jgi:hypothetical protein
MFDPNAEPTNRRERRALDSWLRRNLPDGMSPEEFLEHLRSLPPEKLAEVLATAQ